MDLFQAITVAADVAPASILTVTVESHTTVTVGILQQGSDWVEVAINAFFSFLATLAATGAVAYWVTRYNKNFAVRERRLAARRNKKFAMDERRYKTADLFCANLEQYISDYFASGNDERAKINIEAKYNTYLLGFHRFVHNGDILRENRKEIKREILGLMNLGDEKIPEEVRIRDLLGAVVRMRYLLTK